MTDLEMTRKCAEVMAGDVLIWANVCDHVFIEPKDGSPPFKYDPLHDDAQAMALVKRFKLHPIPDHDREGWWDVFAQRQEKSSVYGSDQDLNRAIVECVARRV